MRTPLRARGFRVDPMDSMSNLYLCTSDRIIKSLLPFPFLTLPLFMEKPSTWSGHETSTIILLCG